jgi:hypothetical protein
MSSSFSGCTPVAWSVPGIEGAKRRVSRRAAGGINPSMHADDNTRDLEQEVAAGQSETTPVALISTVIAGIGVLFVIALGLAALAYALA